MEQHTENTPRLVGNSPDIKNVRRLVEQVARTDATVLIAGDSGCGKEVVARSIHAGSERRDAPFVAINCGAIPEELIESELFGHEKGAFTGAIKSRTGRFEMAAGGTLFLDEIGDMPMHMQVKLLRVLQEKVFERVGGTDSIGTDVRIIAATHQDLEEKVELGQFRLDLYYRLNVFPIEIGKLKDRPEDLPLLVSEIFARNGERQAQPMSINDSAMSCLMHYSWPGNVRELGNLLERLSILYEGQTVGIKDLPEKYRGTAVELETISSVTKPLYDGIPDEGIDLKNQLQQIEVRLIREALDSANWVVARSAKLLNLQRTTLVEKMRKYSIDRVAHAS